MQPDYAEAIFYKGIALLMQNKYTQALECLDKAIILKPALYGAYSSKAKVLEKLGRFDEAINTYKASMVIDSNDPLSY